MSNRKTKETTPEEKAANAEAARARRAKQKASASPSAWNAEQAAAATPALQTQPTPETPNAGPTASDIQAMTAIQGPAQIPAETQPFEPTGVPTLGAYESAAMPDISAQIINENVTPAAELHAKEAPKAGKIDVKDMGAQVTAQKTSAPYDPNTIWATRNGQRMKFSRLTWNLLSVDHDGWREDIPTPPELANLPK